MYWVPYTANAGEGHPFGATYMAGVKLENSIYTSDTATVTEPFSTFLVVTAIIVAVIAIAILIYFKKRKH
jgi:subtilase family serine protease